MTTNELIHRIDLSIKPLGIFEAIGFSVAFIDQVHRVNGMCRVFRGVDAMHIYCSVLAREMIDELIKAWGAQHTDKGVTLSASVVSQEKWDLPLDFAKGEIFHGTITKAFLMSLPAGAWLVIPGGSDRNVDHVQAGTDRQRLWEKLSEAGTAARRRYILWREDDVQAIQRAYSLCS